MLRSEVYTSINNIQESQPRCRVTNTLTRAQWYTSLAFEHTSIQVCRFSRKIGQIEGKWPGLRQTLQRNQESLPFCCRAKYGWGLVACTFTMDPWCTEILFVRPNERGGVGTSKHDTQYFACLNTEKHNKFRSMCNCSLRTKSANDVGVIDG